MLAVQKQEWKKPAMRAVADTSIILECLYDAYGMEGELVLSGKNMYSTIIYPFVKMLEDQCTGIQAEGIHKQLWELYLKNHEKDDFMELASHFMEPYENHKEGQGIRRGMLSSMT